MSTYISTDYNIHLGHSSLWQGKEGFLYKQGPEKGVPLWEWKKILFNQEHSQRLYGPGWVDIANNNYRYEHILVSQLSQGN